MELHSSEEEPKQREHENEASWRLFEATAPLFKWFDTCGGVIPNMDERELHFHHEAGVLMRWLSDSEHLAACSRIEKNTFVPMDQK